MVNRYCEEYKTFLNHAKTETETVREVLNLARKQGFQDFERKADTVCITLEKNGFRPSGEKEQCCVSLAGRAWNAAAR